MDTKKMSNVNKSVAILTKKDYTKIIDVALSLIKKLDKAGFKVYTLAPLPKNSAEQVDTIKELKKLKPDFMISIGGDGSLLWALRSMDDETPVLGVNVGGRGILSEVKPEYVEMAVAGLRDERYFIEERIRLSASIGAITLSPALNEVYINRISQTKTSEYCVSFSGSEIRHRMDGLMISTPTGSTGHAMSFGGPFIYPSTSVILLVPVGPINRLPHAVLPAEPIEVFSDKISKLVIDGQEEFLVDALKKVVIKKHNKNARFIRFEDKGLKQLDKLGF